MANLAIIPARGGSKRIPKKNIKHFLGKPIISYSIAAAIESKLFDKVMVSTDDAEIAEIAKRYGAEVPFLRGDVNSSDHATTFDVIDEVLGVFSNAGEYFENACCIYSAAPFVSSNLLQQAYEKLISSDFDVIFPVLEYSFPIGRSVSVDETGKAVFNWPENALKRSQDMKKSYHDAGQFYWFKVKELLQAGCLVPEKAGVVLLNDLDAHDIDNQSDWEVAEFKFRFRDTK